MSTCLRVACIHHDPFSFPRNLHFNHFLVWFLYNGSSSSSHWWWVRWCQMVVNYSSIIHQTATRTGIGWYCHWWSWLIVVTILSGDISGHLAVILSFNNWKYMCTSCYIFTLLRPWDHLLLNLIIYDPTKTRMMMFSMMIMTGITSNHKWAITLDIQCLLHFTHLLFLSLSSTDLPTYLTEPREQALHISSFRSSVFSCLFFWSYACVQTSKICFDW